MLLVIPYSHIDLNQAVRLMKWIGFLSEQTGYSMKRERVLLFPSRRALRLSRNNDICSLAPMIFGEARCFIPNAEYEVGWPGSANWMFEQALCHVEQFFQDDILFLEPDAVPVVPNWYKRIQDEWLVAKTNGKKFMGAFVPHDKNHMTGVAVYGHNWRSVAPSLLTSPDNEGWDSWSGVEVLPYAHITKLIQHLFMHHYLGWVAPTIDIVDKRAVIFHQDKRGRLIYLLDQAYFRGECLQHPLWGYDYLNVNSLIMRKFYFALNASKEHKSNGMAFKFEALPVFGGSVQGTFLTEDEIQQAALDELAFNPSSGIKEITEAEWEKLTGKKAPPPVARGGNSSPVTKPWPQIALTPTPSGKAAVLVEGVQSAGIEGGVEQLPVIDDINSVLKVGTVSPSQPENQIPSAPRSMRPRKPTASTTTA